MDSVTLDLLLISFAANAACILSLVLQCIVIGALFISFEANEDFISTTGILWILLL